MANSIKRKRIRTKKRQVELEQEEKGTKDLTLLTNNINSRHHHHLQQPHSTLLLSNPFTRCPLLPLFPLSLLQSFLLDLFLGLLIWSRTK